MELSAADLYALYLGGNHVTHQPRFFWKQVNENPATTGERRKRSSYPNFQWKIIQIYKDYVVHGRPRIDPSPRWSVFELTSDLITHGLVGGTALVVVLDFPKVYERFRYKTDKVGEIVPEDDGSYFIKGDTEEQSLTLIPEDVNVGGKSGVAIAVDGDETTEFPFTRDQMQNYKWNMYGESLIRDTAAINLQIYNFYNILDTLVMNSAFFVSTGPTWNQKKIPAFAHVPAASGEQSLAYVSPDTTAIDRVRAEIQSRIMNMASVIGLTREFSEQLKIEPSGVSLAFQMLDINSTIRSIAKMTMQTMNRVGEVDQQLNGGAIPRIELDPLLKPEADREKLDKLKSLDDIQIDELLKMSQKERAKLVFADMPESVLDELDRLIETEGGIKAKARPELSIFGSTE